MGEKLSQNKKLHDELAKKEEELRNKQKMGVEERKRHEEEEKEFLERIKATEYHQDVLDYFCDWVEKRFHLTGVYIGELKNKKKKVNLAEDDSEEAHFDAEAPKLIYFENCSASHKDIMLNQTLTQESVLGRLLTGAAGEGGEEPPAEGEEGAVKEVKPKD